MIKEIKQKRQKTSGARARFSLLSKKLGYKKGNIRKHRLTRERDA
jgi:hypothetical protein